MMEKHYIEAPTFEDGLREDYTPNYDKRFFMRARYRAAKPLLKLWEFALGKEVANSIGIALSVGHQTLTHFRIRFRDEPNTHPQDREAYEDEISRLKTDLGDMREKLRKANISATTGENLVRALRRMDSLVDEKGNETRSAKGDE